MLYLNIQNIRNVVIKYILIGETVKRCENASIRLFVVGFLEQSPIQPKTKTKRKHKTKQRALRFGLHVVLRN